MNNRDYQEKHKQLMEKIAKKIKCSRKEYKLFLDSETEYLEKLQELSKLKEKEIVLEFKDIYLGETNNIQSYLTVESIGEKSKELEPRAKRFSFNEIEEKRNFIATKIVERVENKANELFVEESSKQKDIFVKLHVKEQNKKYLNNDFVIGVLEKENELSRKYLKENTGNLFLANSLKRFDNLKEEKEKSIEFRDLIKDDLVSISLEINTEIKHLKELDKINNEIFEYKEILKEEENNIKLKNEKNSLFSISNNGQGLKAEKQYNFDRVEISEEEFKLFANKSKIQHPTIKESDTIHLQKEAEIKEALEENTKQTPKRVNDENERER